MLSSKKITNFAGCLLCAHPYAQRTQGNKHFRQQAIDDLEEKWGNQSPPIIWGNYIHHIVNQEIIHIENLDSTQLYNDVCQIIDDTRSRVAVYVNSEVCHTNWLVGKRIKEDVLYNQRAEYGKQIIKNLSIKLTEKYGKGWGFSTLQHCVRTAYTFTEEEILYAGERKSNQ